MHACDLIMPIICPHFSSMHVCDAFLAAVRNLSCDDAGALKLGELGICETLLRIIKLYQFDEGVVLKVYIFFSLSSMP